MSDQHIINTSVNRTIDDCKTPSQLTYDILASLMAALFTLGLPLNLSVLYIFVFRYEAAQIRSPSSSSRTELGCNSGDPDKLAKYQVWMFVDHRPAGIAE